MQYVPQKAILRPQKCFKFPGGGGSGRPKTLKRCMNSRGRGDIHVDFVGE